jgi:phosphopantetheinyl transferase (holo-ACP synthase)
VAGQARRQKMSELAIEVRGLCKRFAAKEAVAGIDLEIGPVPLPG